MNNIIKQFIKLVIYLVVISFILFVLLENTTGNPAVQYLQEHGVAQITPERIKMAQDKLGLSQSMPVRYVQWLGHAFTGDLGTSFSNGEPVTDRITQAMAPTLKLILGSAIILFPLGYVIGYLCGNHPRSKWSKFTMRVSQLITSLPEYWLAIIFIYYFGVKWHLFPFVGSNSWQYFVLPITILVLVEGSHMILLSSHLFERTLHNQPYQLALLRQFKLKDRIYVQIKEILAPLLTITINNFIHLFSRVIILEVIFSISGLGKLLINSINLRDYPLIQGILMIIILIIMVLNFLGDILLEKSDPRLRMSKKLGGRITYED
ncbi:Dipeptide transport system permease DppB [Staphylococcus petrasii]|uniref:ABC transporter permease n=1 Tax=Staphylococcus petrasii TaxID=1276936 RepID=A0A380FVK1_9STAP|nr:ABC transporter permease [Staphylococcus petrasii]PNZ33571.1 ABC transporter permease [Staphylococcus petrasii]PNZ84098.1 ABC transporter permease [Staphylococcus petrasii]TGA81415.1 ABC transporter permease [Staphylococcus petrasii]TGE11846.1 ABC transporter permease [Staphylococcus petrasii]TGE16340.1 ABC transporter permease [Staphylococcus petrasii]